MVVVTPGPAQLDTKVVSCWHASDPLLSNQPVIVFIGPSVTTNVTQNSSRIQAHIFSVAGFLSFPRLTINPTSQLYAAVDRLPEDLQGDEIRRGLATGLFKYYTDLAPAVKHFILKKWSGADGRLQPRIFDDFHAASLATKMNRVPDAAAVAEHLTAAMAERTLSWVDLDFILPNDSISVLPPVIPDGRASLVPLPDLRPTVDYGKYSDLLDVLGESTFLPTSRLRRAPSKPTAVSRTRTLDEAKKGKLEREVQELLINEQSYVAKLQDLIDSPAAQAAGDGDRSLQKLFPTSLLDILQLAQELLHKMQVAVQDETSRDPTGALRLSKLMLEYFPRFQQPYQDYLRRSQDSNLLNEILQSRNSSSAQAIQSTGIQRLRSWLIEPVQRLPRYNLFIDSMTSLLPADHPAMSRFLAARDIVTDICSLDNNDTEDNFRTVERLRRFVDGWSDDFAPMGRLVTAVDGNELEAPYAPDPYGRLGVSIVLLLFSEVLVVVEKIGNVSARGLLAEVDRAPTMPSVLDALQGDAVAKFHFTFRLAVSLSDTRLTESHRARVLNVEYNQALSVTGNEQEATCTTRVFQLLGAYEGKASKFIEEIAMARIEHRYPEQTRENDRWALKSVQSDELGMVCAIASVNDIAGLANARSPMAKVRVVMDDCLARLPPKLASSCSAGVDMVVNVKVLDEDSISVETFNRGKHVSVDTVSADGFLTCLSKRVGYLLRLHHRPQDPEAAPHYVMHAQSLAPALEPFLALEDPFKSIKLPAQGETKRFRPLSPVKNLASMFAGSSDASSSPTKRIGLRSRANTGKSNAPAVLTDSQPGTRPMSYMEGPKGQGTLESHTQATKMDPAKQLEGTFQAYVVAIQSRRGNIVGRTLQNRRNADEASVNELYNVLIQDPSQYQSAAEVSVDVLFSSFENFLLTAWKTKFGPILSAPVVNEMQDILFGGKPGAVQRFRLLLNQIGPENKQAFTAMVSLLSELVGATGNDGDRGVLVVTFAEAVIPEGNSSDNLMIFDRLLADADMFLGIKPPDPTPEQPDSRERATGTGSIGSAASSVGKKLGWLSIGLSRGNSKSGEESKFQVSRLFGKRGNADADSTTTPPSLGRSILSRTRSTDTRPTTPGSPASSRPGSSYSNQAQDNSRPGSAHGLITSLAPIAESKSSQPKSPSKKRRSSLSDLPQLRDTGKFDPFNLASPSPKASEAGSGRTSPFKVPKQPTTARRPTLLEKSPSSSGVLGRSRYGSYKENTPNLLQERNMNQPAETRLRATKSPTPVGSSGIPVARHDLPQIIQTPHLSPTKAPRPSHQQAAPQAQSPNKYRSTSPQKIQDRLNDSRRAIDTTSLDLQSEIDKIGREFAALSTSSATESSPRSQLATLSNQLDQLRETLSSNLDGLHAETDAIQRELHGSLVVADRKVKHLDGLYRQVAGENEALYDRFNEELSKAFRGARGNGVEEMRRRMEEKDAESAKLRTENARLRREVLGLRAQLKDI